ncbi:MAG: hypothetical protein LBH06_01135 [Rikenellaceae bacterium]|jgi:hypothetical protein|nr:hypothetical protein [Rikenellaceae bacterium]
MRRFIAFALLTLAACKGGGDETVKPPFEGARPVTRHSSKWIAKTLEYRPAPGQFINTTCGVPEAAQRLVGGSDGMLSLGGFGGYVVFMFDHTVLNGDGPDFVVHGNSFDNSSEPGIVRVSFDDNGNGLPDDAWYELVGADHALATTVQRYHIIYSRPSQTASAEAVAWTDNNGAGEISAVNAHTQSYWPSFVDGVTADGATLSFAGTRLCGLTLQDSNGQWSCRTAGRGYVDNFSDDYSVAVGDDPDTRWSNKFDISDAVDAYGRPVALQGVDFIMVYTAVNEQMGELGEASTEVRGAISLTVRP